LYRAMAWLGEELPEDKQGGATPFAPRCTKDLIEERLFAERRDLLPLITDSTWICRSRLITARSSSTEQKPLV